MNSNDSPKAQAGDFLRLCLYPPLHYLCVSLQSAAADDFGWRGVDGVPLCTDSTFDNEEENAISVKITAHI